MSTDMDKFSVLCALFQKKLKLGDLIQDDKTTALKGKLESPHLNKSCPSFSPNPRKRVWLDRYDISAKLRKLDLTDLEQPLPPAPPIQTTVQRVWMKGNGSPELPRLVKICYIRIPAEKSLLKTTDSNQTFLVVPTIRITIQNDLRNGDGRPTEKCPDTESVEKSPKDYNISAKKWKLKRTPASRQKRLDRAKEFSAKAKKPRRPWLSDPSRPTMLSF